MDPYLRHRWFELCSRMDIERKMDIWNAFVSMYGDQNRYYHNFTHIHNCLTRLDYWHAPLAERDNIELALWFHDLVFDPKRADNKRASAGLAKHYIKSHKQLDRVIQLILATKHNAAKFDYSEVTICDIDIQVFGADEERYQNYVQMRYKEAHDVEIDIYLMNRRHQINNFLSRNSVFSDTSYKNQFNEIAKHNLTNELNAIRLKLDSFLNPPSPNIC